MKKFAVDTAHREFYRNNLKIEFEPFFDPLEISKWRQEVQKVLASRLAEKGGKLEKASSEQLYMVGRDLWRSDPALRKLIMQTKLADIAADLTEQRGIRFGYDQYLPSPPDHLDKMSSDQPYIKWLKLQGATLQTISPMDGVLCGVLISLQENLPRVVYLDPTAPLDLSTLEGSQVLIVYTRPRALYVLQENDPHTYALKHLGLGFGELLRDKWNPTLKR